LLAYQSLCLHVNLSDGLARKAFRFDDSSPFADAEFLQCEFKNLNLFRFPAGRKSVVPQAFGLMVFDFFTHFEAPKIL
jgi:hypothetical protein